MADKKLPEGQAPGGSSEAPGGGEFPEMGSMGGDEILQSALLTSAAAAKAAHDDLKNIGNPVQDGAGDGDLDDIKLQDLVNRTTGPLQVSSNVLKKLSSTAGSIMTSSEGGGGAGQSGKKRRWGLLAALLFVGIAVFIGLRFIGPWRLPPTTQTQPGPPDINVPNPGPPEQPVSYPPNPCALVFVNPPEPEKIPLQGPLEVKWSDVPEAVGYDFRVIPPEGAGPPWIMPTDETSRTIYMENFPAAGKHQFSVERAG